MNPMEVVCLEGFSKVSQSHQEGHDPGVKDLQITSIFAAHDPMNFPGGRSHDCRREADKTSDANDVL